MNTYLSVRPSIYLPTLPPTHRVSVCLSRRITFAHRIVKGRVTLATKKRAASPASQFSAATASVRLSANNGNASSDVFSCRLIRGQCTITPRQLATTLLPVNRETRHETRNVPAEHALLHTHSARNPHAPRASWFPRFALLHGGLCIVRADRTRAYRALRMWSMGPPLSIVDCFIAGGSWSRADTSPIRNPRCLLANVYQDRKDYAFISFRDCGCRGGVRRAAPVFRISVKCTHPGRPATAIPLS